MSDPNSNIPENNGEGHPPEARPEQRQRAPRPPAQDDAAAGAGNTDNTGNAGNPGNPGNPGNDQKLF